MIKQKIALTFASAFLWSICFSHNAAKADDLPQAAPPVVVPQQTIAPPPIVDAKSYILMDADTGRVLASSNADVRLPPASTTKIMSMYVIANAIERGQIGINDMVTISEKAWRMTGSRMFVQVGDRVPVSQLVRGIVVASGNDASVAMAEHVAGSEETFASLMNQQAQALGMVNSHFTDSTGMPDANHYTTAHDLALIARATIKHFPNAYMLYSLKSFSFNNITQPNRNRLLWRDSSVDGLKTGHTDEAGYCLVASAKRGGMRIISVIMGAPSDKVRTDNTQQLLNYGFRFFETRTLYQANKPIRYVTAWYGKQDKVAVGVSSNLTLTLPRDQFNGITVKFNLANTVEAPIQKGKALGQLQVIQNNKIIATAPLVALTENPKAGIWSRMVDAVSLRFNRWFGHGSA